jgi:hypothetical protein
MVAEKGSEGGARSFLQKCIILCFVFADSNVLLAECPTDLSEL